MKNEDFSESIRREAVERWKNQQDEENTGHQDSLMKLVLKRLFTLSGVILGAATGVAVSFLIGYIVEVITKPTYPDMMLGVYLISFAICIPIFATVLGIMFHRLGKKIWIEETGREQNE